MTQYKFKVGDRVRVTKMDDKTFYGSATYEVGCVGYIYRHNENSKKPAYLIKFIDESYNTNEYIDVPYWSAKEEWLEFDKQLIMCD